MTRILALLLALPAQAQTTPCTALPDALAALSARYGEAPRVTGLTSAGTLMVITASEDGGWSPVTPDGTACMAASGSAFEVIAPEPAGVDG